MDSKVKILIGVGVILFICLVTWTIRTTPKAPPVQEKIEPPTVMEYEGNTITEEKDGKKVWEMTADKIKMDSITQLAEIENVDGKFYQEDGKVLSVQGKVGVYDQKTKDMHLEGDVILIDGDGAKITGNNLDWNNESGTLTATEDVKIFRDDMRATGDLAASSDGFRHFFMKGNVRILKGVKDDDYAKEMAEKAEKNLTEGDEKNHE